MNMCQFYRDAQIPNPKTNLLGFIQEPPNQKKTVLGLKPSMPNWFIQKEILESKYLVTWPQNEAQGLTPLGWVHLAWALFWMKTKQPSYFCSCIFSIFMSILVFFRRLTVGVHWDTAGVDPHNYRMFIEK